MPDMNTLELSKYWVIANSCWSDVNQNINTAECLTPVEIITEVKTVTIRSEN